MYAIRSYYELAIAPVVSDKADAINTISEKYLSQNSICVNHLNTTVITSYSIHYTKLYDAFVIMWIVFGFGIYPFLVADHFVEVAQFVFSADNVIDSFKQEQVGTVGKSLWRHVGKTVSDQQLTCLKSLSFQTEIKLSI